MGSFLRQNKGMYSILTTFFFVVVVIFAVLALLYQSTFIVQFKDDSNTDINTLQIISGAKDRLFFCYGDVFDSAKLSSESCDVSYELIEGFVVKQLAYGNCSSAEWSHYDGSDAVQREVYIVPIQDGSSICPGMVSVYI